VASKFALLKHARPVLGLVVLVVAALVAAKFGHPIRGLWDGPI
jgi:hypothetical protein